MVMNSLYAQCLLLLCLEEWPEPRERGRHGWREGERERERETHTQTDTDTDTETDRQTETERMWLKKREKELYDIDFIFSSFLT